MQIARVRSCNKSKFNWTQLECIPQQNCIICNSKYPRYRAYNFSHIYWQNTAFKCFNCKYSMYWDPDNAWYLSSLIEMNDVDGEGRIGAQLYYDKSKNVVRAHYYNNEEDYIGWYTHASIENSTLTLAQIINIANRQRAIRLMRRKSKNEQKI